MTTLHTFRGPDGANPRVGLVQATDGNLYGTTGVGGINGHGTVFRITPAGRLTTLYSFCAQTNCPDGNGPGPFVLATDGNIYGETMLGGASNLGTIYTITTSGVFTVLHSFAPSDGFYAAQMIQATDGNFYGATWFGGARCKSPGCGTVFRVSVGLSPFVSFIRSLGRVGQTVQILGQGFTGTTGVSFDGTAAVFTVKSDTYLTVTVPVGATTGFVTVTTPTGTLKSNQIFRVTPQMLSFSPTSGPAGTSVVITGKSFTQASVVTFACKWQMSFTVDSDTQITAIVPQGATSGKSRCALRADVWRVRAASP